MKTKIPLQPEVLQASDRSEQERPPTTSEFVIEQENDPYCKEVAGTVENGNLFTHTIGMESCADRPE